MKEGKVKKLESPRRSGYWDDVRLARFFGGHVLAVLLRIRCVCVVVYCTFSVGIDVVGSLDLSRSGTRSLGC